MRIPFAHGDRNGNRDRWPNGGRVPDVKSGQAEDPPLRGEGKDGGRLPALRGGGGAMIAAMICFRMMWARRW